MKTAYIFTYSSVWTEWVTFSSKVNSFPSDSWLAYDSHSLISANILARASVEEIISGTLLSYSSTATSSSTASNSWQWCLGLPLPPSTSATAIWPQSFIHLFNQTEAAKKFFFMRVVLKGIWIRAETVYLQCILPAVQMLSCLALRKQDVTITSQVGIIIN